MTCVCLLFGLPATGKSTLADDLLAADGDPHIAITSIACDDVLAVVRGGDAHVDFDAEAWRRAREVLHAVVDRLASNGADPDPTTGHPDPLVAVCLGDRPAVWILVEDDFHYNSMRYQIFQIAKRRGTGFAQVHLTAPLDTCLARNAQRPGDCHVPPAVMARNAARVQLPLIPPLSTVEDNPWVPPSPSDTVGASFSKHRDEWQRNFLVIDTERSDRRDAVRASLWLLEHAAARPVPVICDVPSAPAKQLTSMVERADTALRRAAGEFIRSLPDRLKADRRIGDAVASLRKQRLASIREEGLQGLSFEQANDKEGLVMTCSARLFDSGTRSAAPEDTAGVAVDSAVDIFLRQCDECLRRLSPLFPTTDR